jgi:hypothetical protein
MQLSYRTTLASLALLAVRGLAGSVHREPVHLRATAVGDTLTPLKNAVEASISNFALASPWSAAAQSKEVEKGDTKGEKQKQPVQVQVPEEAVKNFIGTLSQGCSKRFQEMLHGKGPQLHTFGSHDVAADQASCKKLDGKICATEAQISNEKTSPTTGRSLDQTIKVAGDSCLPQECMSGSDLFALTNFMHQQAKSTVPGDEHHIDLKVDCSKAGGVSVVAGAPPTKSQKSGSRPVSQSLAVLVTISALIFS